MNLRIKITIKFTYTSIFIMNEDYSRVQNKWCRTHESSYPRSTPGVRGSWYTRANITGPISQTLHSTTRSIKPNNTCKNPHKIIMFHKVIVISMKFLCSYYVLSNYITHHIVKWMVVSSKLEFWIILELKSCWNQSSVILAFLYFWTKGCYAW